MTCLGQLSCFKLDVLLHFLSHFDRVESVGRLQATNPEVDKVVEKLLWSRTKRLSIRGMTIEVAAAENVSCCLVGRLSLPAIKYIVSSAPNLNHLELLDGLIEPSNMARRVLCRFIEQKGLALTSLTVMDQWLQSPVLQKKLQALVEKMHPSLQRLELNGELSICFDSLANSVQISSHSSGFSDCPFVPFLCKANMLIVNCVSVDFCGSESDMMRLTAALKQTSAQQLVFKNGGVFMLGAEAQCLLKQINFKSYMRELTMEQFVKPDFTLAALMSQLDEYSLFSFFTRTNSLTFPDSVQLRLLFPNLVSVRIEEKVSMEVVGTEIGKSHRLSQDEVHQKMLTGLPAIIELLINLYEEAPFSFSIAFVSLNELPVSNLAMLRSSFARCRCIGMRERRIALNQYTFEGIKGSVSIAYRFRFIP